MVGSIAKSEEMWARDLQVGKKHNSAKPSGVLGLQLRDTVVKLYCFEIVYNNHLVIIIAIQLEGN